MDTDRLFDAGERGTHLLFDRTAIQAAFRHDPAAFHDIVRRRISEIRATLRALLDSEGIEAAQKLVAGLDAEVRDVLVVLYFDVLESRLRQDALHH
jgi:hypothetical protein